MAFDRVLAEDVRRWSIKKLKGHACGLNLSDRLRHQES